MRVLVAGWVNSPHVAAWAAMLVDLGYDVAVVGHRSPALPPLDPPEGIAAYDELALGRVPRVRSLQLGSGLRAAFMRFEPSLVHAHWLPEYGWLASRAGLHPLISSAWGSDVLRAGWLGRRRSTAAIRGADIVLADSAVLAEAARKLVPDGPPVEVFHPGVDLDEFGPADRGRARHALGWHLEVPIVLSTRGLSAVYNPLTLIEAFVAVRVKHPTARLVLKHPGARVPAEVTAAVRDAGVAEAVDIVGHVEPRAMATLYQAADIVVSVPSSDSSPASAWEALACARPLVVSDLPWANAELRHRTDAWITPIKSDKLADALVTLLTDHRLASELGRSGRALVEATMNRRDRARELDQRYRALIASSA
jgi:glycosyltransferase involved in cell wall biosynthesis